MGEYLKRHAELSAQLDKLELQEAERSALREGLTDYTDAKTSALNDLLTLIGDIDSEASTDGEWRRRANRARNDLDQYIGNALAGVPEPSIAALSFRALTYRDEHQFWESLRDVAAARIRDFMTSERKRLEKLIAELEEKWSQIKTIGNSVAGAEATIAAEVRTIFDDRLKAIASQTGSIREIAAHVVASAGDLSSNLPKEVPLEAQLALEVLKKYLEKKYGADMTAVAQAAKTAAAEVKKWRQRLPEFNLRLSDYERLVAQEVGGAYVFFTQTYADTQNFVKDHGYDAAKEVFENAQENLAGWSSSCTGAQRDDAETFARDALEALKRNLAKTEDVFTKFVIAHKGKFFGVLDVRTTEELVRYQLWEDRLGELRVMDLETKLHVFRAGAQDFFGIDLDSPLALTVEAIKNLPTLSQVERDELISLRTKQTELLVDALHQMIADLVGQAAESEGEMTMAKLEATYRRDRLRQHLPA